MRAARFIYGRFPLGGVSAAYLLPLIILALSIGILSAMLGIGGGLLMVPALILIFGFNPVLAAGTGAVGTMAIGISSSVFQHRYGSADRKKGYMMALGAVPAAFLGSYISDIVPERTIMIFLSGLMLLSAYRMLGARPSREMRRDADARARAYYYIILGAAAGVVAGMVGIGGGVLFVPLLMFDGMKAHEATATSSFVIMFSGTASAIGHITFGHVNFTAAAIIVLAAIPGTYIGVKLAHSIEEKLMKKVLGVFLTLVAIRIFLASL